jgi:Zn finger protein HypA/HybF involved in hydrogenase expression
MRLTAQIQCRECGVEGNFTFVGRRECPRCGSHDIRLALRIEELANDDPAVVAITRLAEGR